MKTPRIALVAAAVAAPLALAGVLIAQPAAHAASCAASAFVPIRAELVGKFTSSQLGKFTSSQFELGTLAGRRDGLAAASTSRSCI